MEKLLKPFVGRLKLLRIMKSFSSEICYIYKNGNQDGYGVFIHKELKLSVILIATEPIFSMKLIDSIISSINIEIIKCLI